MIIYTYFLQYLASVKVASDVNPVPETIAKAFAEHEAGPKRYVDGSVSVAVKGLTFTSKSATSSV